MVTPSAGLIGGQSINRLALSRVVARRGRHLRESGVWGAGIDSENPAADERTAKDRARDVVFRERAQKTNPGQEPRPLVRVKRHLRRLRIVAPG